MEFIVPANAKGRPHPPLSRGRDLTLPRRERGFVTHPVKLDSLIAMANEAKIDTEEGQLWLSRKR